MSANAHGVALASGTHIIRPVAARCKRLHYPSHMQRLLITVGTMIIVSVVVSLLIWLLRR
jgi:hypothetical protein